MDIISVLNSRIKERGISVSELSRRVGMNDEMLRRSLAGTRNDRTGFGRIGDRPEREFSRLSSLARSIFSDR